MSTEKEPQGMASSFWSRISPSSWFGSSAAVAEPAKPAKNEAVTPIVSTEIAKELELEKDNVLFEGWTELQSVHSSQTHTIKNYEIIEDDDFSVVSVAKEELQVARKAERDNLKKAASIENIAHVLAYQKLVSGSTVEVLEQDGSKAAYECHRLQANHSGIAGYVLLPTEANASGYSDIKVVFRGTDPSDAQSVSRSLSEHRGGAGSVSFEANSLSLLSQVNQHIKDFSKKHPMAVNAEGVSLTVSGHSLGGSDAQNFGAKVLQAIAEQHGIESNAARMPSDAISHLNLIQKLQVNTVNSAGVPSETAARANDLVKKLADLRAKGETCFEIPESYNIHVGGDGVQATGQAHIFDNVSADQCKVSVLKAHIGSEHHNQLSGPVAAATLMTGMALNGLTAGVSGALSSAIVLGSAGAGIRDTMQSHTTKLFTKPRSASYEMMSNSTALGQSIVAKELSNKSATLNAIQNTISLIGDGLNQASALLFSEAAIQANTTRMSTTTLANAKAFDLSIALDAHANLAMRNAMECF